MEIELTLLPKAKPEPVHFAIVKMFQHHVIFYIYLLLHFVLSDRGASTEDKLLLSPSIPICLEGTWKDIVSSCCDSKLQFSFLKFLLLKSKTKSRLSCVISYHLYTKKFSPMLFALSPELCGASLASFVVELLTLILNL